MSKRDATGEDVANLLLSYAPSEWLVKFDLSHENKHEWILDYDYGDIFQNKSKYYHWKLKALSTALYFANRTLSASIGAREIVSCLNIPSYLIFDLISFAQVMAFVDDEKIFDEIAKSDRRKIAKKAAIHRHAENNSFKTYAIDFYRENRSNFKNKDEAANHIAEKEIPNTAASTVRKWIRNI